MHEILSGKYRIPLGTGSGKHGFYCNPISQCIRFIAYASIVFCVYFGGGGGGWESLRFVKPLRPATIMYMTLRRLFEK